MSIRPARHAAPLLIMSFLVAPVAAEANEFMIPTALIAVPNSPISLTACRVHKNANGVWDAQVTVGNRTHHTMLSVDVDVRAFDTEGTSMMSTLHGRSVVSEPLVSNDTGAYDINVDYAQLTEPESALGHASCELAAATFTGKKSWVRGQSWPEKLLPVPHVQSGTMQTDGQQSSSSSTQQTSAPHIAVDVTNSWNDVVNGGMFVHDTITMHGGNLDVVVSPQSLVLTMNLANGSRKQYSGLTQAAPTYQRYTPIGQNNVTVNEVDPSQDFGRIGPITVPAHGTVTTTVTFSVTDAVASPTDTRNVVVK